MNVRSDPFSHLTPIANYPQPISDFRFVAVGELEYRPPAFLIEGLIETDTLGLLFGEPGCGKSFVAADIGLCVAAGQPFHGHSVRRGAVFYIAGEGHNGLIRRFNAWAKHNERSLKGLPMFKSEKAAHFLDAASALSVAKAVQMLEAEHGSPALIIVDTLARNFGAGDENSTQEMNAFIGAMDELRSNWPECVILIVHHSGHGDKSRARGAMALKGALDFEYRLEKDDLHLTLSNTKMKDAEPPADLNFALETVDLGAGAKSAVLVDAEGAPPKKAKISGQAKIALQAFGDALAHYGVSKHGDMFPSNRQCVSLEHWRELCDRHSLSGGDGDSARRTAFMRAKNTLQEKGIICVVDGFAWRTE